MMTRRFIISEAEWHKKIVRGREKSPRRAAIRNIRRESIVCKGGQKVLALL